MNKSHLILIVIFIAGLLIGGERSKYNGQNAQYWFEMYDSALDDSERFEQSINDFDYCMSDLLTVEYEGLYWLDAGGLSECKLEHFNLY